MYTESTKPSACPACGYEVDAASNLGEGKVGPRKDDITICLKCSAINQFNEDLTLRASDPDLLKNMKPMDRARVLRMVEMTRVVQRQRQKN